MGKAGDSGGCAGNEPVISSSSSHGGARAFHPPGVSSIIKDEAVFLILVAAVVGVVVGYLAIGFRLLINLVSNLSMMGDLSFSGVDPGEHERGVFIVVIPALGGLLVGLLVHFLAREAKGHGVPEVMEAVTKKHGVMRPRVVLVKALASAICIGTGGSVGREGPIVQIGSALGSTLGQIAHVRRDLLKVLVGCGAAAGVAATFNTPISGVIFAFELLLLEFKTRSFIPLVISSVLATMVSRHYLGHNPAFLVPNYAFQNPVELLFYLGLGVVMALVAIVEIKIVYKSEDLFDAIPMPEWSKPVLGGLMVGAIALAFPEILGIGYPAVGESLLENLPLQMLLGLALAKILALSITIGSGGSGGVFAPTLFVGSMVGGAYGYMVHALFPDVSASYGAYALVGMAAIFSGATRATLTSIIILFEMTRDYAIIIPLMFACVVADLITWKLKQQTIYTAKLIRRGTFVPQDMQVNLLEVRTVSDSMVSDVVTMGPDNTLCDYEDLVKKTGHRVYPIVQDGLLQGIVTDLDTIRYRSGCPDIRIGDIMCEDLVTAFPSSSLQEVFQSMVLNNISHVPVVQSSNVRVLKGIICMRDIMHVLGREM